MTTIGTRGRHVLAEYWGCDPKTLASKSDVEAGLLAAARAARATVVSQVFHQFSPTGVSGVVVIEESHLSVHTWPEDGYAAADFYTCGECVPERALDALRFIFRAGRTHFMVVDRGLAGKSPSFEVVADEGRPDGGS